MIAEGIKEIASLVARADSVKIKDIERLRLVAVDAGGAVNLHPYPRQQVAAKVFGIDDLIAFALDKNSGATAPEVYHSTTDVVLVLDRKDRHERVTLALPRSAQFERIVAFGNTRQAMTAPELIRVLRFDLPYEGATTMIAKLRKVDFTRTGVVKSDTQHGREGFSRSVEATVQSVEDVPEEISITVPFYVVPGLTALSSVTVRCGIYIDTTNGAFVISPLADEITKAMHAASMAVGKYLRSKLGDIPVLYGTP